jgi:hypothetical protein
VAAGTFFYLEAFAAGKVSGFLPLRVLAKANISENFASQMAICAAGIKEQYVRQCSGTYYIVLPFKHRWEFKESTTRKRITFYCIIYTFEAFLKCNFRALKTH